ncbi:MAG: transporter substrate-binding domain-containing protein [Anaerolineae bacterium]|nr:transporter substrate-binding domain-containing protein [Anaerolineae bacterium]
MKQNRNLLIIVGLLALLALALAGLLGYYFFVRATVETPDTSWEEVQTAGHLVVGTSADYNPFEYYVSDFQLDGFDIALMDAISQRLGVRSEYKNYAFNGLGDALQLDQIDVAVAAISVNPERAAEVDFSNIYLVTEDAVLSLDETGPQITQVQDVAGFRIGVQSQSVHHNWARTNLVDTGLVPTRDLLVYQNFDQAVNDLKGNRVDLLITDLPVAQEVATTEGVTIAGQGLNPQRLAIALPKGATSLKAQIDRALAELQSEGVVAELAEQYLDIQESELLPTPTATAVAGPTPTPGPPSGECLASSSLVEHLTFDDQNMTAPPEFQPGQAFTKGWRIRNRGTCTWDESFRLVYAHGNSPAAQMGGQPLALSGPVEPGETVDLELPLFAPLQPGIYQGFWQLTTGDNEAFGERFPVGIQVPGLPTPTPAPTQTPAPGIDFTVDRTTINRGECVTFAWNVDNVREVYFYAQGERWQDNGVSGQDSRTVCPSVTTIYELRVVKTDGSVEVRQITITVEAVVGAPNITRFSVDPSPQITVGQCVQIRWEVQGDIDEVVLAANNRALWEGAPMSGSLEDCPPGSGKVDYTVEASGPGGISRNQRTITVVEGEATPVPTPEPEMPIINAFEVVPNQVEVNQCVTLSWRTGGGTTRVQLKQNGAIILDNAPFEGSSQSCSLSEPGQVVFRVDAFNSDGQNAFEEEAVSVSETPADNPLLGTSWVLETMPNGTPVLDGTNLAITFGVNNTLNGSGGCNSYSAEYVVSGQSLAITPPSSSQQFCAEPEGIMEQEATYLSTLPTVGSFRLEANTLTLLDSGGNTVLTFLKLG